MCLSKYTFNSRNFEDALLEYFPKYVIYHRDGYKSKMCYCTCCGQWFGASSASDLEDETYRAKHGDQGNCPICDYPVKFLAGGRMSTFYTCNETKRFVWVDVVDYNTVVLRAYYCTIDYSDMYSDGPAPLISYDLKAKYILTPGSAKCYFNNERYTESEADMREVSIREPFAGLFYNPGSYMLLNVEDLNSTFLQYSDLETFSNCGGRKRRGVAPYAVRQVSYLCYYALYPQLEFLLKEQAYEWVSDLVYDRKLNKRFLDWSKREMNKFFRMTKPESKAFCEMCFDQSILKLWYKSGKKMKLDALLELANFFGRSNFLDFYHFCTSRQIDLSAAKQYLAAKAPSLRLRDTFVSWRDYIRAAEGLGYDLSVHNVLFPRALLEAHDNAVASEIIHSNGKLTRGQLAGLKERKKRFAFKDKRFEIIVPMTVEEIVAEGRMQRNCVAGYAERHINGTLTILFLRERSKPDESFYTIEYRDGEIKQCRGYSNEMYIGLRDDEKERAKYFKSRDREGALRFKDKWWCWVAQGSPRDASGKPIVHNAEKANKAV